MRDPDGYYIEFCGCEPLENYLELKTIDASNLIKTLASMKGTAQKGERLKQLSMEAKQTVEIDAMHLDRVNSLI